MIASAVTLGMLILTIVLVGLSFRGMEQAKVTAATATARRLAISVDDRIQAITQPPSTALAVLGDPLTKPIPWNNAWTACRLWPTSGAARLSVPYTRAMKTATFSCSKYGSSTRQFPDAPANSHYLLQSLVRTGNDQQGRWHFYDRNLNLLEQRDLASYNFDPRERPWYQAARESGTLELSAPYVFFTTQETGITLSQRASEKAGTVLGIDVTVTDLGAQLAELKQTPGSRIAILNASGQLLAGSCR